jgi:hypothetical protein
MIVRTMYRGKNCFFKIFKLRYKTGVSIAWSLRRYGLFLDTKRVSFQISLTCYGGFVDGWLVAHG